MTLVAILAAAAAAGLACSGASARPRSLGSAFGQRARPAPVSLVVVMAVLGGTLMVRAEGVTLGLGLIGLGAALAALRLVDRARRRRAAERRQATVVELCQTLAAELRSGQPPVTALARCCDVWSEFDAVVVAARLGADVPTALRRLATLPGAAGLRDVAGAWQVSQGAGSSLSLALGRVAASARHDESVRRVVASELASAQATARLVAALPLFALTLGSGIGGDPWGFLLATPPGLVCLATGLALVFAGLTWIEHIAAGVMRR